MKHLLLFTTAAAFFFSCKKVNVDPIPFEEGKLKSILRGEPGHTNSRMQFEYKNGRVSQVTGVDSIDYGTRWTVFHGTEYYFYDESGKLSEIRGEDGETGVKLVYDTQNRLIKRLRPTMHDSVIFNYDDNRVIATMNFKYPSTEAGKMIFYFSTDLDSIISYNLPQNKKYGAFFTYNSTRDLGSIGPIDSFDRLMKADLAFSYFPSGFIAWQWLNVNECTGMKTIDYSYGKYTEFYTRTVEHNENGFPKRAQLNNALPASKVNIYYEYYEADYGN